MTSAYPSARDVVAKFYKAAEDGDLATVEACLDEDVVIREAEGLPYAGVYKGREEALRLVRVVYETWKMSVKTLKLIGDEGDTVAVLGEITGTAGPKKTPFKMLVGEFWQVRAGKVIDVLPIYYDTKKLYDLCHPTDQNSPA